MGEPGIATVAHPLVEAAAGETPAGAAAGAAGATTEVAAVPRGAVDDAVDAAGTEAGTEARVDAAGAAAGTAAEVAAVSSPPVGVAGAGVGSAVASAASGGVDAGVVVGAMGFGAEAETVPAASVHAAEARASGVSAVDPDDSVDPAFAAADAGAVGSGAEAAGAGSAATVTESPDDALGEDVSRAASTRAMNLTRRPSTATIAVRRKSLVPIPVIFCCLKLSASA